MFFSPPVSLTRSDRFSRKISSSAFEPNRMYYTVILTIQKKRIPKDTNFRLFKKKIVIFFVFVVDWLSTEIFTHGHSYLCFGYQYWLRVRLDF